MPQYTPTSGTTTAAAPNAPRRSHAIPLPAGPPAENHIESTASRAKTTSPIPIASRAQGERICRVEVRALFFDDREARRAPARWVVFRATYTSMITGRMTGLRWVIS